MTISEVSKQFNLSLDTLRYYEKIGLIDNVKKVSGKRDYTDEDLNRIKFILCMRNAGLPLKKIIKFVEYNKIGDSTIDQRLEILKKQKELLEFEIAEKRQSLDYLNYKINLYESKKK